MAGRLRQPYLPLQLPTGCTFQLLMDTDRHEGMKWHVLGSFHVFIAVLYTEQISQIFSICTKSLFLSNYVYKFVYIPVSEHFSFNKIIHPPDRCGISRSWLNSMIIIQVHLVLGKIKGHSKMCRFVTQHNATDVSSWGSVQLACCQIIVC